MSRNTTYLMSKPVLFVALILLFLATQGRAEDEAGVSLSLSYTVETADGGQSQCKISSTDNKETRQQFKNSRCKLSKPDNKVSELAAVDVKFNKQKVKRYLVTTREVLSWAHLAIHAYKIWDSGASVFSPPICPCSGAPKKVTNLQRFFLFYYSASFIHHAQKKFSPFFMADKAKPNVFSLKAPEVPSEKDSDETTTWFDHAKKFASSHSGSVLSLIMDSAALKWDCRCAGYFTNKNGGPYFNGHLWMLFLDVAIFATDLAIDYL